MSTPALNFDTTVSASTAKQDKIEIAVQFGTIVDQSEDVGMFLRFLGPAPYEDLPENLPAPQSQVARFGTVFNHPRKERPPFYKQSIRKRNTRNQLRSLPLFGGYLNPKALSSVESAWRLDLLLSVNPTRFLRYQQFPTPKSSLLEDQANFNYTVFQNVLTDEDREEFALVESDNWIPNERLWNLFSSPRFWQQHLRQFLTRAMAEIRSELNRAASFATVQIEPITGNTISLYYVETYWEFLTDDPIGKVLAMQPMLETFAAANVDFRDYPLSRVALEMPENSRCLKLETRSGEILKIYAKTDRRIRFEVCHQLSGPRPFRLPNGGHTFREIEDVLPLLTHLALVSAERVNAVLRHFQNCSSVPDGQKTVLALICDFQAACGDPESATTLLQILSNLGSIKVGTKVQLGKKFRAQLERLVRRRILQRSNNRYSIGSEYRRAFSDIQERGIGFLWGPRVRRKNQ